MTRARLLVWVCPAVSLAAALTILLVFGLSLWSVIGIAIVIACPFVVAWVLVVDRQSTVPRERSRR